METWIPTGFTGRNNISNTNWRKRKDLAIALKTQIMPPAVFVVSKALKPRVFFLLVIAEKMIAGAGLTTEPGSTGM